MKPWMFILFCLLLGVLNSWFIWTAPTVAALLYAAFGVWMAYEISTTPVREEENECGITRTTKKTLTYNEMGRAVDWNED